MTRKIFNKVIKEAPKTKEELLDLYELKHDELPTVKTQYHDDVVKYIKDKRVSNRMIKQNLKSIYNNYVLLFPVVNSLLKKLNYVRTIIKELRDAELYKLSTYSEYFNISKEDRKQRMDDYKKSNVQKNNNPLKIDFQEVKEKLDSLLSSNHRYTKGAGLLIASGLRPIELMCVSEFEIDKDNKNNIIVSKLAKKRKGMSNSVSRPIIGLTPEEFIDKVKMFRDSVDNPCKKSETVARGLQRAFNSKFPEMTKQGRFLFTRKIYSELAFQEHAPEALKTNKPLYLSQILGHSEGDVQTAQSYSWIMS